MVKDQEINTVVSSPPVSPLEEKKDQYEDGIVTDVHYAHPTIGDAHRSVGLAVIEQKSTIPQTGQRKVASKLEYWLYIVWCKSLRPRIWDTLELMIASLLVFST